MVTFGSPLATVLSELVKLENIRRVSKKLEGKGGGGLIGLSKKLEGKGGGLNWFKPGLGLLWKRKGKRSVVHFFDFLPKSSRSKTAERGGALIRLWIK